MASTVLLLGGDNVENGSSAGAVILGNGAECDWYVKAAKARFAYDGSLKRRAGELMQSLLPGGRPFREAPHPCPMSTLPI
ncbi:MAG: hypothetical protein ACLR23_29995 [Clostridia bacterium]